MVPGDRPESKNLIVTSSEFKPEIYGKELMDSLRERLGVKSNNDLPITFIISTTMNPWLTDLHNGDSTTKLFLDVIQNELRTAVYKDSR